MDADYIFRGAALELEIISEAATNLRSQHLRRVAETYHTNNEVVLSLLALPLTLLTVGEVKHNRFAFVVEAMILSKRIRAGDESREAMAEIYAQSEKRYREVMGTESKLDPVGPASTMLQMVATQHTIKEPLRALLYACALYAWSAVECALKDAWINAVNIQPIPLGQRSIAGIPSGTAPVGITSKQVSVGLLAKHGFDLRDKIGTIVSERYDFTSVNGICEAYCAILDRREVVEAILLSQNLRRLEAIRHLIAHRAGLVDEQFLGRTGDQHPVGLPLVLGAEVLCPLIDSAIVATTKILEQVDDHISDA
jgi:hypothetical protein